MAHKCPTVVVEPKCHLLVMAGSTKPATGHAPASDADADADAEDQTCLSGTPTLDTSEPTGHFPPAPPTTPYNPRHPPRQPKPSPATSVPGRANGRPRASRNPRAASDGLGRPRLRTASAGPNQLPACLRTGSVGRPPAEQQRCKRRRHGDQADGPNKGRTKRMFYRPRTVWWNRAWVTEQVADRCCN